MSEYRMEDGFRVWDYDGSLHPEDAMKLLRQTGTQFSGCDWKYGWPHKFYIEPVNPEADKLVEVGSKSGPDVDGSDPSDVWRCFAHEKPCTCPKEKATGYYIRPIMGHRQRLHFKFYSAHLAELTDEQLKEWNELSERLFGISWMRDEKGIKWSAPPTNSFYGYQQYGIVKEDGTPDFAAMTHP